MVQRRGNLNKGTTEATKPKRCSKIYLTVKKSGFPSKSKLDKIKAQVVEKHNINLEEDSFEVDARSYMSSKISLTIKIVSANKDLPMIAALELFVYLLGNIKIYGKSTEYGHFFEKE